MKPAENSYCMTYRCCCKTRWSDITCFAHSSWCGSIRVGTKLLPSVPWTRRRAQFSPQWVQYFSQIRLLVVSLFLIASTMKMAQPSKYSHLPIIGCFPSKPLLKASVIVPTCDKQKQLIFGKNRKINKKANCPASMVITPAKPPILSQKGAFYESDSF